MRLKIAVVFVVYVFFVHPFLPLPQVAFAVRELHKYAAYLAVAPCRQSPAIHHPVKMRLGTAQELAGLLPVKPFILHVFSLLNAGAVLVIIVILFLTFG